MVQMTYFHHFFQTIAGVLKKHDEKLEKKDDITKGGWRKGVIYKVKALLIDARTRNAILDTVYKQTKMTRTYLPANL